MLLRMVKRVIMKEVRLCAREFPVLTIFGPRQSGKSTLAELCFPDKPRLSFEDPDVREQAGEDPRGLLNSVPKGAILDEIQRAPNILSYLQGVVDTKGTPGRFILTGSHQPSLREAVTQSLAGRTAVLTLLPFCLAEMTSYRKTWDAFDLIVSGFYPRLHEQKIRPASFFSAYVQTYLERDVRMMVNVRDLRQFQQVMTLLAGRVGQLINYTSLANDTGVSVPTIRSWVSVLEASHILLLLPPYSENITKRVVKPSKIYFTDPGLAAWLAGIRTVEEAAKGVMRGGLYENLVIVELFKQLLNEGETPHFFFYRDNHGNETDLIIKHNRTLIPIEIKSSETFHTDFHKGVSYFRKLVPSAVPGYILYNGERETTIHDTRVLNLLHSAHGEVFK